MNNRIAEIRERCEREKAIDAAGRKANGAYITTTPYLLAQLAERDKEIERLNRKCSDVRRELMSNIDTLQAVRPYE